MLVTRSVGSDGAVQGSSEHVQHIGPLGSDAQIAVGHVPSLTTSDRLAPIHDELLQAEVVGPPLA